MSQESGPKKFFRSERPVPSVTGRPCPLQKRPADVISKPKNSTVQVQEKNSIKPLNSPLANRSESTTSLKIELIPPESQKMVSHTKNRVPGKKNNETTSGKVANNVGKENRSEVHDQDESSSSDNPSTVPVSHKRRIPPKKRAKVDKLTGSKMIDTDMPGFKKVQTTLRHEHESDSSFDEGDSDLSEEEEEMRHFGKQVGHLMEQLGSKIENRIRTKSEKLTKAFENVLSVPPKIVQFELEQGQQRQAIIQNFQSAFAGIHEKLQQMNSLQAENVDKCSKLFDEATAAHESGRKEIAECKKHHNSALTNHFKEEERVRLQSGEEVKLCMEQNNKEIRKLKTKLMLEGELQSSEALTKL